MSKRKFNMMFDWKNGEDTSARYRVAINDKGFDKQVFKVYERNKSLYEEFYNRQVVKAVKKDLNYHITVGDKKLPMMDVCELQDLLAFLLVDSVVYDYEFVVREKEL